MLAVLSRLQGMPVPVNIYHKHRGWLLTASAILTFATDEEATLAIRKLHGKFVKGLCTKQTLVSNYARVSTLDRRAVFEKTVFRKNCVEKPSLEFRRAVFRKAVLEKPSLDISMSQPLLPEPSLPKPYWGQVNKTPVVVLPRLRLEYIQPSMASGSSAVFPPVASDTDDL